MGRETLREGVECPVCKTDTAVIKVQANGRWYIYGRDCCNSQLFARTAQQQAALERQYGQEKPQERAGSGLVIG